MSKRIIKLIYDIYMINIKRYFSFLNGSSAENGERRVLTLGSYCMSLNYIINTFSPPYTKSSINVSFNEIIVRCFKYLICIINNYLNIHYSAFDWLTCMTWRVWRFEITFLVKIHVIESRWSAILSVDKLNGTKVTYRYHRYAFLLQCYHEGNIDIIFVWIIATTL